MDRPDPGAGPAEAPRDLPTVPARAMCGMSCTFLDRLKRSRGPRLSGRGAFVAVGSPAAPSGQGRARDRHRPLATGHRPDVAEAVPRPRPRPIDGRQGPGLLE